MPTRELLSEGRRAPFSALPDTDGRELVRHYTFSEKPRCIPQRVEKRRTSATEGVPWSF